MGARLGFQQKPRWTAAWQSFSTSLLCVYNGVMHPRVFFSIVCWVLVSGTTLGVVQALRAAPFPYAGVLVRLRRAGVECAAPQLSRGTHELRIRALVPVLPAVAEQLQIEIIPDDPETQGCVRERFSELLGLPYDRSVEPALAALQRGLRFVRGQPEPRVLKQLRPLERDQWRRVARLICPTPSACTVACEGNLAAACWVLGNWHREGKRVRLDEDLALRHLNYACELGEVRACDPFQLGHDLNMAQIAVGIQQIQPKLARCWQGVRRQDLASLRVEVKIEILESGAARMNSVSGGSDARVHKCVQRQVARLRFPESSRAQIFSWPIKL
jgi:hypothetical protein